MKITRMTSYGRGRQKIGRLGLTGLFLEVQETLLSTTIILEESARVNGASGIKQAIDASFSPKMGWVRTKSGGIHLVKRIRYNHTFIARLGVEIQVSARSDLLIRDVVHLRNSLQKAEIDVGIIVVPDDRMQKFLPDRTPAFSDATRYIEVEFKEATTFPIVVLAIEHDGPGKAIPKKTTNLGTGKK
jgi:restriction endonuclease BglII